MFESIFFKLNTLIQLLYFKIIYGNKISFGKNINFRGKINIRISGNGKIKIGSNCFFNKGCSLNCKESIIIGNDCLFGENVKIYDHDHIYEKKELIRKSGYKINPIIIGNNVWVCTDVIVLRKSIVGNNCVIAAKEIVKNHINDDCIFSKGKESKIVYK